MVDLLLNLKVAWAGMVEYFGLKMVWSVLITIMGYLVGAQHFEMIYALMFLAMIDFITGLFSAKINGLEITSKKSMRSASKFVVYILFIAAAHLSESILPGETFFENIVTSFLALTEFISIIENIGGMGFAIPQQLLNKLRKYRDEQ